MIKTLGQNGLNFIASKYKELKSLITQKADKSEIKTKLSELAGDSTHRTVTDTEKTNWNNKIDKVSGKGLSTNDYDSTAKSKVDAIPSNPKYTDTVVEVVDNLSTSDSTKALSASQGKALQDNKADKSDISRCKTKGFNTSNTWQSLGTTRDLEDWIGDFDKRTRETRVESWFYDDTRVFKSGKPLREWSALKLGNIVILSLERTLKGDALSQNLSMPSNFRPSKNTYFNLITFDKSGTNFLSNWYLTSSGSLEVINAEVEELLYYNIQPFTVMYQI